MKFDKTCKIPGGPQMVLIERTEVFSIVFFKAGMLALVLLTILGTGGYYLRKFQLGTRPYAAASSAELEQLQVKSTKLEKAIRQGNVMIHSANYRMANQNILSALFRIPYPDDNTYALEKFSLRAVPLTQKQAAVPEGQAPAAPQKEMAYVFELNWKSTTPAAGNTVQQITQQSVQHMRPDFLSKTMTPWKIEIKTEQSKNSGAVEYYDNKVAGTIQPAGKTFDPQPGKKESDRLAELRSFYSQQQTP